MNHLPYVSSEEETQLLACPVLSDHVVEEILARLPAKQVVRLRCLSRAWAATLSSSGFEDLHLRAANLHGGPRIMCMMQEEEDAENIKVLPSSLDGPGGAPFLDFPSVVTGHCYPPLITPVMLDCPHYKRGPHLTTQTCHGLVILEALEARLFHVYNPSTRQIATLPEGRTTGPRSHTNYAYPGLGYDARTGRHKVVRVHYRGDDDGRLPLSTGTGCEIYEINKSNSESEGSWRTISGKPTCWIDSYNTSVFAQGHCYWLAHRKLSPQEDLLLLSFSVSDETFGTVQVPRGMRNLKKMYDLTKLNGRLCIFRIYSNRHEQYDVWLLNGHGSDADWHLHCRIDLPRAFPELRKFMFTPGDEYSRFPLAPLAIIDGGRRILLAEHDNPSAICAYTTDTGYAESLVDTNSTTVNLAAVYEESIASPGCQPCERIALISSSSTQALLIAYPCKP